MQPDSTMPLPPTPPETRGRRVWEVAALFLRIGAVGFGGPAVTIAMMEDEIVTRRRWLSRAYFMDVVGATNLIPGPNATEIAIHAGYLRAGWPGLLAAGISFIVPAALMTFGLAWAYGKFGTLPQVMPFLAGIKPAVLAVILTALWRLGRIAVKGPALGIIGLAAMTASLVGANEIAALLIFGLLGMAWLRAKAHGQPGASQDEAIVPSLAPFSLGLPAGSALAVVGAAASLTLLRLGLFFLQVGAVLYGSGYVLIAFLEGGLVQRHGWLTQQQLLDAVAAGQLTPGPLLSTSTFIGYLLMGVPGALVTTTAVFLPSFLMVVLLTPFIPRLRRSPWAAAFLDAVNVSSVGLMAAVMLKLGQTTLVTWQGWLIAALAAGISLRWRLNSAFLVLGGAVVGWALAQL
ncbi:MAG: chromate efflux transporter [Anaerolineae bacterium]